MATKEAECKTLKQTERHLDKNLNNPQAYLFVEPLTHFNKNFKDMYFHYFSKTKENLTINFKTTSYDDLQQKGIF